MGKRLPEVWDQYDLFLFDLDGTLITSYMERDDKDFHKWNIILGRDTAVASLIRLKKKVGIITNQAGIGFGYNEEREWEIKIGQVRQALMWSLPLEMVFVCFAHPNAKPLGTGPEWDPDRRKPSPWMIQDAMGAAGVEDTSRVLFVGDMESDYQTAVNADVNYVDHKEFFGE